MSENRQVKTGTAWIVCGAIVLAWTLYGVIRLPFAPGPAELAGGIVGVLLFGGLGAWLLVTGLRKRRLSQ